jgi:hypothetical protein
MNGSLLGALLGLWVLPSGLRAQIRASELASVSQTVDGTKLTIESKQDAFVVTYENGIMRGQFDPNDDYMNKFALIRTGPDTFAPGLFDEKGELYEVLRPDLTVEFTRTNGRGSSLELRDDQDKLEGRAVRDPR